MKPNLRVRLTGSMYRSDKALSNTLYGGDRAGSRYYYVLRGWSHSDGSEGQLVDRLGREIAERAAR